MAGKYIVNIINGGKIRTLSFSGGFAAACLIALVVFISGAMFLTYDYISVKKSDLQLLKVQKDLERKKELIESQRNRLHYFAEEINSIRDNLVKLDKLEEKIRIIADLGKKNDNRDDNGIFGIGGIMPEPIDSRIGLDNSHSSLVREMTENSDLLKNVSDVKIESMEELLGSLEAKRSMLASTPAIRPAKGWITSPFGYRDSPFTGKKEFHEGYDIANRKGTSIIAPADGIVSFVGKRGLLGNAVLIDHGHGIITKYGHLDEALVKAGQKVKRGHQIAKMGNSGRSTGPHLHYVIYVNGRPVNPEKYILD
ncbi:MAG: peptidoglycan DD-metalloendopeptidase family protein [Desulfobacteraceae bacterium]|nr:peptidoglycan DD-metalloendopeptidase family protein [Desulfobacteraceae bacterium]MCB9495164.1 peptidoglycan DD-metalloendopeptidase family protein [Desulfobacteraceae bacterium]